MKDSAGLVDVAWLVARRQAPDVRVVDARWFLPGEGRDARAEYATAHIPDAVYFDIDDIADTTSPLPHMLPSPEKFASRVRRLGLGDGNRIVVYDTGSWLAAARVWWMFRTFGHEDVAVLDGGLAAWQAAGLDLDDRPAMPRERHFTARFQTPLVRDFGQMRANLKRRREQVVDARSRARFAGTAPEPRPGVRAGHIPGSLNLPYGTLIDDETRTLRPDDALAAAFAEAGVDLARPITTTCGSGVSAAVLNLALYRLGRRDAALYDGSWTEWGQSDAPIETGEPA